MSRDPALYLADIEESCRRILAYTAGMSADRFRADQRTVDAVVRNLEIIGEAVKHLPVSIKRRCTKVDWRRIAGFRDTLIHAYFGIDFDIVLLEMQYLSSCLARVGGRPSASNT